MKTTELLNALEVVFIGMEVITVLILGVLVAWVILIFGKWRHNKWCGIPTFTDKEQGYGR